MECRTRAFCVGAFRIIDPTTLSGNVFLLSRKNKRGKASEPWRAKAVSTNQAVDQEHGHAEKRPTQPMRLRTLFQKSKPGTEPNVITTHGGITC